MKRTLVLLSILVLCLSTLVSAQTVEVDVVVIGGGGAGLSAANAAAEGGASVILLEKMPFLGGSTILSGGAISFAGTDLQKERGIVDSNELYYEEMLREGRNKNIPALVQTYIDEQLATYYWLVDQGVEFVDVGQGGGMSVARAHYVNTVQFINALAASAESKGVDIQKNTTAVQLLTKPGTKEVVGVLAEKDGQEITYLARKGVVLASGGFGRDAGLLEKFVPVMAGAMGMVGAGCTGDGLRMAWNLGADIYDTPYIKATFGMHPEGKTIADLALTYYSGAIIVNQNGERFVDESINYKAVGDAALAQPGAIAYQIWDEKIRAEAMKDPLTPLRDLEAKGMVYKADTLEELAALIDVPAENLEATVARYNNHVEQGIEPDFGRTSLNAGSGTPVKINEGPFYAFPSTGVIFGTYGGILIDSAARVIDVYGEVIPGLYAAGEVTGGLHGAGYMTGTAVGKAVVFGRIAGQSVLAD
ncbi:MAG: flavocytochrome c [Limnochordia bacterium]|jgi:fumarate reductase flavoprotein subunit